MRGNRLVLGHADSVLREQLARDDEFLNLGRALVDPQRPYVSVQPLDDFAVHDAAGAE